MDAQSPSTSDGSDLDPPHIHIKAESDSDSDAEVEESEDEYSRTFEPKPGLPEAKVEHRTLQNLMDLLDVEAVDLNPTYQRDVVWNSARQTGLIDSIIENFYIPPILFNRQIDRSRDESGRIKRVCVDGKQRLTSIKAFMEGTIGCHDRRGGVWYYTNADRDGKTKRRTISEPVKELFQNKKLICYEYTNLLPAQEEDLFARVQLGMQLNTAEKLRASTGPWQEFAKLYEKDFPKVLEVSSTKRSAGFIHILMSFVQVLEVRRCVPEHQPSFKSPTYAVKALCKHTADYNPENMDILRRTFVKFQELIEADPQTFMDNGYQFARLFSPFEMIATSVLISILMDQKDNQFLLGSLRGMRLHLRQNLQDLRMNKATWLVAWDFIMNLDGFPKLHEPENLAAAYQAPAARQEVAPPSLPVSPNQPVTSLLNPTPRVPSNHTPFGPLNKAGTGSPEPAPLDTSHHHQLRNALSQNLGDVQNQQSNVEQLHFLDGMQFEQPANRRRPTGRPRLMALGRLSTLPSSDTNQVQSQQPSTRHQHPSGLPSLKNLGSFSSQPSSDANQVQSQLRSAGYGHLLRRSEPSPEANGESASRAASLHVPNPMDSTLSIGLQPSPVANQDPPIDQSPRLEQGQPSTTQPSRTVDQGPAVSPQSVSGIRKKKLARFTTSGASPWSHRNSQSAEPATKAEAMPEASPPSRHNGKRPSESVIVLSDDEETESAQELLEKFKPHVTKRIKVEDTDS